MRELYGMKKKDVQKEGPVILQFLQREVGRKVKDTRNSDDVRCVVPIETKLCSCKK